MGNFKFVSLDQSILERVLPEKESLRFEDYSDDNFNLKEFEPYIGYLPEREQDLVYMYYSLDKKQKEIASFFQLSQGAISHRLTRARERLVFIRDMPKVTDDELIARLTPVLPDMDMRIAIHMVHTTCQSATAEHVSDALELKGKARLTQVKVRHKFYKAIKTFLAKYGEDDIIYKLLLCISKNPYKLWEVKLPHFNRGSDVFYDDGSY